MPRDRPRRSRESSPLELSVKSYPSSSSSSSSSRSLPTPKRPSPLMKAKEDFVVISDESNHPSPLHKPLPSSKQLPYKRLLLNGFLLLDASNNVFPDNALEADISGKGYSAVQTEDLEYFTRLEFLNGSENALQLFDLSRLSTLRDLRLNFNRMRNIALPINGPGFESLLSLDLSYNRLIPESFLPLQSLPVLKILDVSGNELNDIPDTMADFKCLERLILEHNRFANNDILLLLSLVPKLRHCSLAHNFLTTIPPESCQNEGFRCLDTLDISFNYLSREEDLMPLVNLYRIESVMCYGNPLLGPTGEDALHTYVEALDKLCEEARTGREDTPINILTEIPKRRVLRKGAHLGRHAIYRNVPIINVEPSSVESKLARQWRSEGNFTLFAQAMQAIQPDLKEASCISTASSSSPVKDYTFMTTVEDSLTGGEATNALDKIRRVGNRHKTARSLRKAEERARELLMQDTQRKVDQVMTSVMSDLGLMKESSEMRSLTSRVRHSPLQSGSKELSLSPLREGAGEGKEERERIPQQLFTRTLASAQSLNYQPVEMTTALKALRYAIQHPLTNYDELPAPAGQLTVHEYAKPTVASAVRRVDTIASSTARQGDGSGSPSLRLRTGTKQLGENSGERFVTFQDIDHQETLRADVLGKVSQVLEGLNRHTREVVEEALLVDSLGIAGKSNTNSGSSSKRGARTLLPRTLIEEAPQEQRESELERLITMVSAVVVGPTETPASRLVNR